MALTWSLYCLYYLNKTCRPSHCHSSLMATGALGHTHVRLHVLSIEDPNKAQVNTKATRIIINTNIYTYIKACTAYCKSNCIHQIKHKKLVSYSLSFSFDNQIYPFIHRSNSSVHNINWYTSPVFF